MTNLKEKALIFSHSDLDGVGSKILQIKLAESRGLEPVPSVCSYNNIDRILKKQVYYHCRVNKVATVSITDLPIKDTTRDYLIQMQSEFKFKLEYIDHHKNSLYLADLDWATVHYKLNGEYMSAAKLIALKYPKLYEDNKAFIDLVHEYDTYTWKENNNISARDLNVILSIDGEVDFTERYLSKPNLKEVEDVLGFEEKTMVKVKNKMIETQVRQLQRSVWTTDLVYKGKTYKCGIVTVSYDAGDILEALLQDLTELDIIIAINTMNWITFRSIKNLDIDLKELTKLIYKEVGGVKQSVGCKLNESHTHNIIDSVLLQKFGVLEFKNLQFRGVKKSAK